MLFHNPSQSKDCCYYRGFSWSCKKLHAASIEPWQGFYQPHGNCMQEWIFTHYKCKHFLTNLMGDEPDLGQDIICNRDSK